MKDLFHRLTNWIDHNRYVFAAVAIIVIGSLMASGGCLESQTFSLTGKGEVNRTKLIAESVVIKGDLEQQRIKAQAAIESYNAEITAYEKRYETALEDLNEKDLRNTKILETVGGLGLMAAEGSVGASGVIGAVITIGSLLLAGSTTLDDRRKDKVIAGLKDNA